MMPAPMMIASAVSAIGLSLPRRGGDAASAEPGQVLGYEIRAYVLDVRVGDALRHGTGDSAVADRLAVHRPDTADAEAGRGQEDLVGRERVIDIEVALFHGEPELRGELHGRAPADPGQHVLLPRCVDAVVAHHEDVAP